jgi:hypothetical protein
MTEWEAREVGDVPELTALIRGCHGLDAGSTVILLEPYTPLKRSRRSRLRYRWTMATERFRRSLARRIYDFEDGW